MEQAYNKLKTKHNLDIVFLIIGLLIVAITIYVKQPILIVFSILPLLLGLLTFYGTEKHMKDLNYIKDNYRTGPAKCLNIINKKISYKYKAIGHDKFKSDYSGHHDRLDSRKTKDLETLKEMKAEIEKYCPVDLSTY